MHYLKRKGEKTYSQRRQMAQQYGYWCCWQRLLAQECCWACCCRWLAALQRW
jgi:hypothetical protein